MVIAGLFFVGLPLILVLLTGKAKALLIALAGFAFVFPVFKTMRKNEPRTYSPDSVPPDLLP